MYASRHSGTRKPSGDRRRPGGAADRTDYDLIAIVGSAGAVDALIKIVPQLPAGLPVPVVAMLHRRRPTNLPAILGHRAAVEVKLAQPGELLMPGRVYVAMPDRHIIVDRGRLLLPRTADVNFCRPSADVLLGSVAAAYGSRAIAVVLSGLGRDGAAGARALRDEGGFVIVQDERSAPWFDMPSAARDFAKADLVLPSKEIAFALQVLTDRTPVEAFSSSPSMLPA